MPAGKVHDRITYWSLPPLTALVYGLTQKVHLAALFALAYVFSGLMFGPDLDIHSVQYRRWGVLRWLWLPYRRAIKHRSWLSHGFIAGTVIRLLYLGVIGTCMGFIALSIQPDWRRYLPQSGTQLAPWIPEILTLLIGLESAAMGHSLSDYLSTVWKKRRQRKKPRRSRR
ncbi:MAG: metal-binding protein [Cyanobacteriota bacterium]|jgi:uncharacterized metal-binding protein